MAQDMVKYGLAVDGEDVSTANRRPVTRQRYPYRG